jgi:chaperonin GroES
MTKTNVKPLGDKILIKRAQVSTTKGGIILPESAQEKPKEGIVVRTGAGKLTENGLETITVKEGDRVLFTSYAGTQIQDNNEELIIMSEQDILGILS